jgi:serine protease SohB
MPNFSDRLTREGITVEDVTAGKYKRTLTPYKKSSNEDRAKMKEEVEGVLGLFKGYLKVHRPKMDVDKLATGEYR